MTSTADGKSYGGLPATPAIEVRRLHRPVTTPDTARWSRGPLEKGGDATPAMLDAPEEPDPNGEPDAWRRLPGLRQASAREFADHSWQAKNSVTNVAGLERVLGTSVPPSFYEDVALGLSLSPMAMRLSPHLLALIDWSEPYVDPLRRQFIPVASQRLPDHPLVQLDPLHEREHMRAPGLTHRYPHKALLLAAHTCPVYCRFCTRSYAVGVDTPHVNKVRLRVARDKWREALNYLSEHPEIEDVVVSGGDAYQLRADQIDALGLELLAIPHIRRLRFASKGLAVLPQKILTDEPWTNALTRVVEVGRRMGKHVALHVHFNHPREITPVAEQAMLLLFQRGIVIRNQAVLLRNVNDDIATLKLLVRRLSGANVHPYYIYLHDLAKGVEDLRTTLHAALELEKQLRGFAAGFNTPCFVVDVMGGGGKRDVHSLEYHDAELGVTVFRSPVMDPSTVFYYVDPLDLIPETGRQRWTSSKNPRGTLERIGLEAQSRMAQPVLGAAFDGQVAHARTRGHHNSGGPQRGMARG
jgi:lysine 2,3-aminomutase